MRAMPVPTSVKSMLTVTITAASALKRVVDVLKNADAWQASNGVWPKCVA
jgi:hypothetical protein